MGTSKLAPGLWAGWLRREALQWHDYSPSPPGRLPLNSMAHLRRLLQIPSPSGSWPKQDSIRVQCFQNPVVQHLHHGKHVAAGSHSSTAPGGVARKRLDRRIRVSERAQGNRRKGYGNGTEEAEDGCTSRSGLYRRTDVQEPAGPQMFSPGRGMGPRYPLEPLPERLHAKPCQNSHHSFGEHGRW